MNAYAKLDAGRERFVDGVRDLALNRLPEYLHAAEDRAGDALDSAKGHLHRLRAAAPEKLAAAGKTVGAALARGESVVAALPPETREKLAGIAGLALTAAKRNPRTGLIIAGVAGVAAVYVLGKRLLRARKTAHGNEAVVSIQPQRLEAKTESKLTERAYTQPG